MNRRQFLQNLGAIVAALVVPAAKRDERIEQLERELAVQAAYWQEQYEQVKERADRFERSRAIWMCAAHEYKLLIENLQRKREDMDHWYQGAWHTEAEWQAHLLEQDRGAEEYSEIPESDCSMNVQVQEGQCCESETGFHPSLVIHGGNQQTITAYGEFVETDLPHFVFHEMVYDDWEFPSVVAVWEGSTKGDIFKDGERVTVPVVLTTVPTWNMS